MWNELVHLFNSSPARLQRRRCARDSIGGNIRTRRAGGAVTGNLWVCLVRPHAAVGALCGVPPGEPLPGETRRAGGRSPLWSDRSRGANLTRRASSGGLAILEVGPRGALGAQPAPGHRGKVAVRAGGANCVEKPKARHSHPGGPERAGEAWADLAHAVGKVLSNRAGETSRVAGECGECSLRAWNTGRIRQTGRGSPSRALLALALSDPISNKSLPAWLARRGYAGDAASPVGAQPTRLGAPGGGVGDISFRAGGATNTRGGSGVGLIITFSTGAAGMSRDWRKGPRGAIRADGDAAIGKKCCGRRRGFEDTGLALETSLCAAAANTVKLLCVGGTDDNEDQDNEYDRRNHRRAHCFFVDCLQFGSFRSSFMLLCSLWDKKKCFF